MCVYRVCVCTCGQSRAQRPGARGVLGCEPWLCYPARPAVWELPVVYWAWQRQRHKPSTSNGPDGFNGMETFVGSQHWKPVFPHWGGQMASSCCLFYITSSGSGLTQAYDIKAGVCPQSPRTHRHAYSVIHTRNTPIYSTKCVRLKYYNSGIFVKCCS